MPAVSLTRSDEAGEVSPVPVAEALLQQLIPFLDLLLSKGLGVPWLGRHLAIHNTASIQQPQVQFSIIIVSRSHYCMLKALEVRIPKLHYSIICTIGVPPGRTQHSINTASSAVQHHHRVKVMLMHTAGHLQALQILHF